VRDLAIEGHARDLEGTRDGPGLHDAPRSWLQRQPTW
jgi:hypothetical protein